MRRELGLILFLASLIPPLVVALAWIHSNRVGYERTWSDARTQTCSRIASVQGRLLWQGCDLNPFHGEIKAPENTKQAMPADFVVGTNSAGPRV
jgi:hypothetical protein